MSVPGVHRRQGVQLQGYVYGVFVCMFTSSKKILHIDRDVKRERAAVTFYDARLRAA